MDAPSWRLPTKEELSLMYQNLHTVNIGSFTTNVYWSSSEGSDNSTWGQNFSNGYQNLFHKSYVAHVRTIRTFKSDFLYKIGGTGQQGIVFHVEDDNSLGSTYIIYECAEKDIQSSAWRKVMNIFDRGK